MNTIEDLNHHTLPLQDGGKVVVLNNGATLTPEMTAMLQALHSREIGGIDSHLKVLAERGADKFMSTYYVGYGHKSIGDCGVAIVFIEGVSMLAAKAVQDDRLYNGQEASTRYISFAEQRFLDPTGTLDVVQEGWRQLHLEAYDATLADLKEKHLQQPGESDAKYLKALSARAFDTTRGFLPAGATTNLAWTGTLRQFADRIMWLRAHPLAEVREIADVLEQALLSAYPNSFKRWDEEREQKYADTIGYISAAMQNGYYHHNDSCPETVTLAHDGFDHDALGRHSSLLEGKPAMAELPKWLAAYGTGRFEFLLDYGSYRDIQRHRAVVQRMPLLTDDFGFHPWYVDNLPNDTREQFMARAHELITQSAGVADAATRQYYLPMGLMVSNELAGDVHAPAYLVELRAQETVHPSLALRMVELAEVLQKTLPDLTLSYDATPDRFSRKRGEADIVKVA
jgi:thymidylate synthase ThyX